MKKLRFIGSSLDDLKNFPAEARRSAGFELDTVQRGNMPSDFKPLLSVGAGAYEIRIHVQGEWRIVYVALLMMLFTSSMLFIKQLKKHAVKILNWQRGVINNW